MAKLLIQGARVCDPANNRDAVNDILIERGTIAKIASSIAPNGSKVIDARGKLAVPGLVDLHTHLRQPGREDKETTLALSQNSAMPGTAAILLG